MRRKNVKNPYRASDAIAATTADADHALDFTK